eukprot:TRINITY_DN3193_c0_g3_i2.p1 TRINITY_DN3193_c0_g3~~TRINITY_DN3193_c0_g3_i2.p1  ORF type:complete len:196 (+),score=17.96 TRINITY_DN3193_c0_g3_i2:91-678(+)
MPGVGPVTNLIYVHSKTMIVDDRHALIGSANINDRSMLGDRDTEIAVHCFLNQSNAAQHPEDQITITMNGKPYVASKFVHSFRMDLMREHLGLTEAQSPSIVDVLSDSFWNQIWLDTAFSNYVLLTSIFPNIPSNFQSTIDQMKAAPKESIAAQRLDRVRGHLMMYPLQWLLNEDLWPASLEACALTKSCYYALT